MEEDVIFSERSGELLAHLFSEIDHHAAKRMRDKIDLELFKTKPLRLVLDFSEVAFMDSSGIGLILGRVESARAVGCEVRAVGLSPSLMKLVRLSGLERVRGLSISPAEGALCRSVKEGSGKEWTKK